MKNLLNTLILVALSGISIALYCVLKKEYPQVSPYRVTQDTSAQTRASDVYRQLYGPFRGFIINAAQWRLDSQQRKRNFFEVMQLARWLSEMQPDNGLIWENQAWNIAYNVATYFTDAQTRWLWVRRALNLLLEDGLSHDPQNYWIRNGAAGIIYDKVAGGVQDNYYCDFQRFFAQEMARYVGNGSREDLELMQSLAHIDPKTDSRLTHFYETLITLKLDADEADPENFKPFFDKVAQTDALKDPAFLEGYRLFRRWQNTQLMMKKWKVDPAYMLYIEKEYGPFDWRMPMAYVVYYGADCSFEEFCKRKINDNLPVQQSMLKAFEGGRLLADPNQYSFMATFDPRIVGRLHAYIDAQIDRDPGSVMTRNLHDKFLKKAIATLYIFNQTAIAKRMYDHYFEDHEHPQHNDPDFKPEPKVSFDDFIQSGLKALFEQDESSSARNLTELMLFQAYFSYAFNDPEAANGYFKVAHYLWSRNKRENLFGGFGLFPPFEEMLKTAKAQVNAVTGGAVKVDYVPPQSLAPEKM